MRLRAPGRLCPSSALAGGDCNNDLLCGPWYLNLNNVASNSNWNIGASPCYSKNARPTQGRKCAGTSSPLGENYPDEGGLSKL